MADVSGGKSLSVGADLSFSSIPSNSDLIAIRRASELASLPVDDSSLPALAFRSKVGAAAFDPSQ